MLAHDRWWITSKAPPRCSSSARRRARCCQTLIVQGGVEDDRQPARRPWRCDIDELRCECRGDLRRQRRRPRIDRSGGILPVDQGGDLHPGLRRGGSPTANSFGPPTHRWGSRNGRREGRVEVVSGPAVVSPSDGHGRSRAAFPLRHLSRSTRPTGCLSPTSAPVCETSPICAQP